ncbi:WD domain-containing protein [Hortaea werneckii]|nr:WD domain-containing protein [Hortaea werneckii]
MEVDERGSKRQKLTNGVPKSSRKPGTSRLFTPYRTIGLVSPTAVPFTAVPLGKTTFQITTSVGRSLQTYDLRRGLNLVFITRPQTPGPITASTAWKDKIFGAWSEGEAGGRRRGVWVFKRGKKEAELEMPAGWREDIKAFCIFGGWIIGVAESSLLVWKNDETYDLYTILQGISPVPFTRCITSLPTFLNKILIGREDGSAEIWNVSSGKHLYTILPPSTTYGAVTAIEPTPALSLVAIAYGKGPIRIQDIKTDQTVLHLSSPSGAPATSISFRTDALGAGSDGKEAGVMATASTHSGDITLWDLNNGGRKAGILRAAHGHPSPGIPGGVSKTEFLPGQAILVSSGLDNSLKTWIFDQTPFSPIPRILHQRAGHGAAVTRLGFIPSASDGSDDTGKWLMSGSRDRSLWGWSLRRDGQSTELSQGAVTSKAKKQGLLSGAEESRDRLEELKCPPITQIACSLNRDGGIGAVPGKHPIWTNAKGKKIDAEVSGMTGWESVVTAHEGDSKARTWFWGRKRAGRWAFPSSDESPILSVAISPCGTFAVVGSEKGGIDMFNLQSGMHRQRFPARLTPQQAKQLKLDLQSAGKGSALEERSHDGKKVFYRGQGKHASPVVGLAIDSLNKTVISAGSDGKVKFWDFSSGMLKREIDWSGSAGITGLRLQRSSELAAFSCTDGCVRVVDISTAQLIRELWPSRRSPIQLQAEGISDLCFSSDAHLIAAALGAVVLVWDLPTGHLVDAFKLPSKVTSLAFSPTGEFLATATTDSVGVDVWSNKALFSHVPARHISAKELASIVASDSAQAPTASGENGSQALIASGANEDEDADEQDISLDVQVEDVDQLSSDLLSLSLVPRSRWQNLLHLDLIKQRNKPIEPPKKPEKAPFFLPSLQDRQSNKSAAPAPQEGLGGSQAELEKERGRVMRMKAGAEGQQSQFTTLLRRAGDSHAYGPFINHLQTLNPAAADIEIRSLSVEAGEMETYIHALTWLLKQRRAFELAQAWMGVFLQVHGDLIFNVEELGAAVRDWKVIMEEERRRPTFWNAIVFGASNITNMAQQKTIYAGTLIHCRSLTELKICPNGAIGVDESGKIAFVRQSVDETPVPSDDGWKDAKVVQTPENGFFFPGFIDTHIHASQYPNAGVFGKSTLLDWLNTYTFPLESSLSDLTKAARIYNRVVARTLSHGTTTACYYATVHVPATNLLADICQSRGQRAFVGRVCMDRLSPEWYRDENVETAVSATKQCIEHIQTIDPHFDLITPIITPRFAPSCTDKCLQAQGQLVQETGLPCQTHISENKAECELVREMFPANQNYTEVYDLHGLLTDRTILAHAIYLSPEERQLIKRRKAKISHCPASNTALTSGTAKVRTLLDEGLEVGLGTDVSGGYTSSLLAEAREAVFVSRHVAMDEGDKAKLSVEEALYLATRGGAKVVGLEDRIGGFEVGKDWDAQMVCLGGVEEGGEIDQKAGLVEIFGGESWEEKMEKWLYTGDDRNTVAVWVKGRLVHSQSSLKP